jgi:restriction system protein
MASAREAERARQAYERAQILEEKERKRLYVEARVAEAAAQNAILASVNTSLEELLRDALEVDDYLDFDSLKDEPTTAPTGSPPTTSR